VEDEVASTDTDNKTDAVFSLEVVDVRDSVALCIVDELVALAVNVS
jgi:hypothetical protein